MSPRELIAKINAASRIEQVLDPRDRSAYRAAMATVHPDVCQEDGALYATTQLTCMMNAYENGRSMADESGEVRWNGWWARYSGEAALLRASERSFRELTSGVDPASANFRKYLPEKCRLEGGGMVVEFGRRAVPLSSLPRPLDQVHVNWVLSRMLEFSAWVSQRGLSHCCLNPESVFVVPETHGIQVTTHYLLSASGGRLAGVSGKYQHWYPHSAVSARTASALVDLEACKRTAAWLLGDDSGVGVSLRTRGDVNKGVLDFILSSHEDATSAWKQYRGVLDREFKKQFHTLDV